MHAWSAASIFPASWLPIEARRRPQESERAKLRAPPPPPFSLAPPNGSVWTGPILHISSPPAGWMEIHPVAWRLGGASCLWMKEGV